MNTETPNPGIPIDSPGIPSVVNQNTRSTRGLSRLAHLSERQLEHINAWLDETVSYRKIVELCRTEFQVEIPHMTIARYHKRSAARQQLDDLTDSQEAAAEISKYAATGDASFSANTLQLLEQQAFDLALAFHRDGDDADLSTLAKLWTLIHKAKNTAIRTRHAAVQEQKCALRAQELELKRIPLQNHGRGAERVSAQAHFSSVVFHPRPTSNSCDDTTLNPLNRHPVEDPSISSASSPSLAVKSLFPSASFPSESAVNDPKSETRNRTSETTSAHHLPLPFPSVLPPEVIKANLLYAEKVRTGKIIIDRSGPWVRAIELSDRDAAPHSASVASNPPVKDLRP